MFKSDLTISILGKEMILFGEIVKKNVIFESIYLMKICYICYILKLNITIPFIG